MRRAGPLHRRQQRSRAGRASDTSRSGADIAKASTSPRASSRSASLLALDGKWQQLEKIRILMGAEIRTHTEGAPEAVRRERAEVRLDESLEDEKDANPFLHGVAGDPRGARGRADRVPRLRQGQVPREGLHHARQARGRRLAGAGRLEQLHAPGPHQEHRAQHPDPERPRGRAAPGVVRGALERGRAKSPTTSSRSITRHTRAYTPFDVYAKALQEFFRGHELTATEWDETQLEDVSRSSTATRRRPTGR